MKKQLKSMYDKQPERFNAQKELVKENWRKQLKPDLTDEKIEKTLQGLDSYIESGLLEAPVKALTDQNLKDIFDKTLHVNITNNAHVAGQVLELTKMTLTDSLWEPRRHSDVHTLNTSNAKIRLNTKDEALTVHNDYTGGADFLFAYDVHESAQPALTFEKNVNSTSHVVLEHKLNKLKTLNRLKLIEVKGTVDPTAFTLDREYKQGLYKLLLNTCNGGFCLGVQKLAIPVATLALIANKHKPPIPYSICV